MLDNHPLPCHSPIVSDGDQNPAPCVERQTISAVISKMMPITSGWGGARANAGGARIGAGRRRTAQTPAPLDTGPCWFCVRTCQGMQLTADIEIRRQGFTVFNPSVFQPAAASRRTVTGVVIPARPDRIVPLFRGYLFARFHRGLDNWRPICRLPGVDHIISSNPERPVAVPQDALDVIRGILAPNDCLYPASARREPIARGVKVRLAGGAMAGLDGLVEWSDGARVRLLLEIMGRRVRVTAAQDNVEIAS